MNLSGVNGNVIMSGHGNNHSPDDGREEAVGDYTLLPLVKLYLPFTPHSPPRYAVRYPLVAVHAVSPFIPIQGSCQVQGESMIGVKCNDQNQIRTLPLSSGTFVTVWNARCEWIERPGLRLNLTRRGSDQLSRQAADRTRES